MKSLNLLRGKNLFFVVIAVIRLYLRVSAVNSSFKDLAGTADERGWTQMKP